MKKVRFLFHASPRNNLKVLRPMAKSLPEKWENGEVVFATDSIEYASFFVVPTTDVWASMGNIGGVFYFVCSDENKFKKTDKGGTIYKLPRDTFKNYTGFEWYSTTPVKFVHKKKVNSGLDFMIENNVQVYFVDSDTISKIKSSKDHGAKILNNQISENEKRGLSVKSLNINSK